MNGNVEGEGDRSADRSIEEHVEALAEHALETQVGFEPPADPEQRTSTYLREGLWPVIDAYIDVVSAGGRLDRRAHDHLETAANVWLELYARCYGESIHADVPVRSIAETFVDTHNIRDTAQLLTGVPERRYDD